MLRRRLALTAAVAALLAALLPAASSGAAPVTSPEGGTGILSSGAPAPRAAAYVPGVARWRLPASVRQVVVVRARSWTTSYGTVTLWSRSGSGWQRVATWPARLGWSGMVVGSSRVQDSGKTPAGLYRLTQTFGRLSNPGTRMPYTHVTLDHWWVEDRRSAYYNQMRLGRLGGFALRRTGYNSSERLAAMGAQYDYAAVIDFNRPNPVVGRGAGIFLHAFGTGATVGCVAIRHDHMAAVLRWLDPAASPRIILGPDGYLSP